MFYDVAEMNRSKAKAKPEIGQSKSCGGHSEAPVSIPEVSLASRAGGHAARQDESAGKMVIAQAVGAAPNFLSMSFIRCSNCLRARAHEFLLSGTAQCPCSLQEF